MRVRPPAARVIGVVVMAVAGLLAVAACGGGSGGTTPTLPERETVVSGVALPDFPSSGGTQASLSDPALGREAPLISGADLLNGADVTSDTGRPLLIAFYAHWCPHCQREVDEITAWERANEGSLIPEGVDFVGVSTLINAARGNHPPERWLRNEGWTLPIVSDPSSGVAEAFGLPAVPFMVGVTADGVVAWRHSGNLGPETIQQLALALLGGELVDVEGGSSSQAN